MPGRTSAVGRCRYGILLRDDGFIYDDGVVARIARRPFPRDHDDRRRGARARDDGGLPPDRMAGPRGLADLDHRAMGGHRRAGARGARACSQPLVAGIDIVAAALPHMGVRERQHLRRADAAVPRQLHRRARLRDQCAGRLRPRGLGGGLRRPVSARHHALRHRDDARAARREGLHHRRPGHRRHGDAGRCRPRLGHRQAQAGLRRQALARARGDEARRSASSSSACSRAIRQRVLEEGAQVVAEPRRPSRR